MPVIAVTNQKGGVGKTTITFNLAKGLAGMGYRVVAIDNDPQGNLTSAFLEDPTKLKADVLDVYKNDPSSVLPEKISDNLFLIGSTIHLSNVLDNDFEVIYKLREGLEGIIREFDFVLIDCLPSFGYLNTAAINAADFILIPVKAAPFALAGLKDLFKTVEKVKKRLNNALEVLGIVINLSEGRQTSIGDELEGVLRATYEDLVFTSKITKGVKVEESPVFNQSIMEYDPKGKPAEQFSQFMNEFIKRIEAKK